tara:strand:- start:1989 stop:2198 length:210 start_codon:yes stop_codon:yes gene_type:complete
MDQLNSIASNIIQAAQSPKNEAEQKRLHKLLVDSSKNLENICTADPNVIVEFLTQLDPSKSTVAITFLV